MGAHESKEKFDPSVKSQQHQEQQSRQKGVFRKVDPNSQPSGARPLQEQGRQQTPTRSPRPNPRPLATRTSNEANVKPPPKTKLSERAGFIVSDTGVHNVPEKSSPTKSDLVKSGNAYIAPVDVQEYNELDHRDIHESDLPEFGIGKHLNRYRDILPNPVTRVRLKVKNHDPSTEYINANYIRSYGSRSARAYIAAQGPLPSTLAAFLRMLWEKKITVIAMLTNLVEGGKKKCERYWPETVESPPIVCGKYSIRLDAVETRYGYDVNHLTLKKDGERRAHPIVHFFYNTWPDHGVPHDEDGRVDVTPVLTMLQQIRETRQRMDHCKAPLLVHCSAGIGRTGTAIVIDQGMIAIEHHTPVDVTNIIAKIREDRMAMVQHSAQYRFAHQAILQYAEQFVSSRKGKLYALTNKPSRKSSVKTDDRWIPGTDEHGEEVFTLAPNSPKPQSISTADTFSFEPVPEDQEIPKPLPFKPLQKQPWFRTDYSRAQVDELLEDLPIGAFLVRHSSKAGHYALSVQQGNHVAHLLIVPVHNADGPTQYKLGLDGKETFPGVAELVDHFVKNPYSGNSSTGDLYQLTSPDKVHMPDEEV